MKASELREKTAEELKAELVRLRKEQFGYRMQKAGGQLGQTHLLKETRRDIARIKSVLAAQSASAEDVPAQGGGEGEA